MAIGIQDLALQLKQNITVERLQEISVEVINSFKKKDNESLQYYARHLEIDTSNSHINTLFAKLIQVYHPDKIAAIRKEIDHHHSSNDLDALIKLQNIYSVKIIKSNISFVERNTSASESRDYSYTTAEDYEFDNSDFGYDEYTADDLYDEEDSEDETDLDEHELNFTEAANNHFYGNLDDSVTIGDLRNLDGELDLSDSDIVNLKGVEYCINILFLNLSGNRIRNLGFLSKLDKLEKLYLSENHIENISALSSLSSLKELDLSYNNIEDISPLLDLESLAFVNIVGNPVVDKKIIVGLESRNVIVII